MQSTPRPFVHPSTWLAGTKGAGLCSIPPTIVALGQPQGRPWRKHGHRWRLDGKSPPDKDTFISSSSQRPWLLCPSSRIFFFKQTPLWDYEWFPIILVFPQASKPMGDFESVTISGQTTSQGCLVGKIRQTSII